MQALKIGYVPYSNSMDGPGDRRRFCAYANKRNLPFEIASPEKKYDLVIVSEMADISVWNEYAHGKVVYDLIDSYLAIPRSNIKQWLRGSAWYLTGRYRNLKIDLWSAIHDMCHRADAVICSTEEQKMDIQLDCENVHIILDMHDSVTQQAKESYQCGVPFNLVWEGLPSNLYQLKEIQEVLARTHKKYPIVLNVVTDPEQTRLLGRFGKIRSIDVAREIFDEVKFHRWDAATCSTIIRNCDLGVIPINLMDPFVSGKPENKLLLLWRMGMPVVTSATPAYQRAMKSVGFEELACRNNEEWLTALEVMIENEALRREVGIQGRNLAETKYSTEEMLLRWDRLFASLGFNFGVSQ